MEAERGDAEVASRAYRSTLPKYTSPDDRGKPRHRGRGEGQAVWAAIKAGMRTLREDGMQKVIAGETTLDEVMRVTQLD